MAGALDGVRVLELAAGTAGQYLGQLLADQGADVLKIEPPGGDPARGRPEFHVWNRGKRSATADVSTEAGLDFVRRLAAVSDVLIADFRPGEAEPLGLEYGLLARESPHLVYAWLPPYGREGPLAGLPPDDALAEALGGICAGQPSESGDPVFGTLPLAAYGTALLAASGVAAALLARERDGAGQQVTVSWLAGALAVQTGSLVRGPQFMSPVAMAGLMRKPQGAIPVYRLYKAADDWLFIACGNNVFFNKLCIALDRPELAGDERFSEAPWGLIHPDQRDALNGIIEPIIASQPREHWLQHFQEFDVPCAPVLSRHEFIDDPQVLHNGLRLELEDPELGRVAMAGVPFTFSETRAGLPGPAPGAGEHTDGALDAWGGAPRPQAGSSWGEGTSGGPLDGVRVLDLTSYIAGPVCPMVLSEYGADVIKIESLEGDAFRTFGLGFLGWNRGKRGVALDLKSEEGRSILRQLARTADVVVENFRPGVAQRLAADYETLRALNPDLVYCSIAGWGESGPYADRPAFDPLLQARSGAQRAQGGEDEPVFFAVALTDYSAGLLGAYAVTAALYVRRRTRRGQRAVLTLTGATMAIQSGEFIFPAGGGDFGHQVAGGKDFLGPSAARRAYRCADGWLFLACSNEVHWAALAKAIGRPELAYPNAWPAAAKAEPDGGISDLIASMLAAEPLDLWVERLVGRGVPCAPVVTLQELLDHPQVEANSLAAEHDHPTWGHIRQTGVLVDMSRTPGRAQRVAPNLGQHNDEILRELGYDEGRVAALRESGIII